MSDTPEAANRDTVTADWPDPVVCWSNAKSPVSTVEPIVTAAPIAWTRTNGPAGSDRLNASPWIVSVSDAGSARC